MRPCRMEFWRFVPGNRGLIARFLAVFGAPGWESAASAGEPCHYTYVTIPNPPNWVSLAYAINNLGHVTGRLQNAGDAGRGFFWSPETGTLQIPRPPGVIDMWANDLNDHDQVVGQLARSDFTMQAYVWDGAAFTFIDGPPGAQQIFGNAINNAGQVVGYSHFGVDIRAYVWEAGVYTDLGTLIDARGSFANDINEHGVIVGYGYSHDGADYHAFEIENGSRTWLNEPLVNSTTARAMNNNDMTIGWSKLVDSEIHFVGTIWIDGRVEVVEPPVGIRNAFLYGVNDGGRSVGFYNTHVTLPFTWQFGGITELRPLVWPSAPQALDLPFDINNAGQIVAWYQSGSVILNPVWTPGDLTGDCAVTMTDLAILLTDFGASQGTYPRGDVDADGDVDLRDLSILLTNWGR